MEIIKTAREHFAKKFKGTIFDDITKEMNDNEIVKLYEKSIYTTNELQEIKENGTTLYFVTFLESQKADIEKYMVENKMYTYDYNRQEINFEKPRFNVYAVEYVPEKFIEELEANFDVTTKKAVTVLGMETIRSFSIGQKVKIIDMGMAEYGTVEQNKNDLIIKKYRTKSKKWKFGAGDVIKIKKIDSFKQ